MSESRWCNMRVRPDTFRRLQAHRAKLELLRVEGADLSAVLDGDTVTMDATLRHLLAELESHRERARQQQARRRSRKAADGEGADG